MADEEQPYKPKDAIGEGLRGALTVGVVGSVFSGIQASLTKQNIGPFGAITRYGRTIAAFTVLGFTYPLVRNVTSNLRGKDDWKSSALGGFASGSIVGFAKRSLPMALGIGTLTATLTGLMTVGGGRLMGPPQDPDLDVIGEKEKARKRFRVPVEQTIAELGEGRGIYGPGYAERRKQKIKENYGIDVP